MELPPLRKRIEDLEPLATHLLTTLAEKYERRVPLLRDQDLRQLATYHFPGNVRELRNLMERSLLKTPEEAPLLNLDLGWLNSRQAAASRGAEPLPAPSPAAPPRTGLSPLEAQEYEMIRKALQEEGGGIRRAAGRLGLTHQALLRRLQKWPELRQG